MTDKLFPCPFCGGVAAEKLADGGAAINWIECQDCGAKGPWAKVGHDGRGSRNWNTRPAPKVKPLEFLPFDGSVTLLTSDRNSYFASYQIWNMDGIHDGNNWVWGIDGNGWMPERGTLAEAKAAAQADYSARILAALMMGGA